MSKPTAADLTAAAAARPDVLELDKLRGELARHKRTHKELVARLRHAEERAGLVADMAGAAEPAPIKRREKAAQREATAVILCSDWHVEERVDPKTIGGRNKYNPKIARERAERLAQAIEWELALNRGPFAIRDIVLWLGGDIISGYIHEELVESNHLSPTEAVLLAQDLITGLIRYVLEHCKPERLIVPCNYGNHGRTTPKKRISTGAANSYEWLMYQQLARVFEADERVEFHIADGEQIYLRAYDFTLRFQHGDACRYGGGVGGITIPINRAIARWQRFRHADIDHLGHFHHLLDSGPVVVNGSLVGYGSYALHVAAEYEPPQQAFYLLDSKRGKCHSTPLWVDRG